MGFSIGGAVNSVVDAVSDGVGAVGGALSDLNPFKKPKIPGVTAPEDLTGPKAPTKNPVSKIQGAQVDGAQLSSAVPIAGPTAATLNMMPQNAFRDQQAKLAAQLAQQASGQGPSIAENQLRAAQEQNIAAQYAAANSARGGYNAAVTRQAMQQGAEVQGQLAQQAAILRLQEQQAAQGMLGQVAGQARATDLEAANAQAQLQQQANLAGYQGAIQQSLGQGQMDQAAAIKNAELAMQTQQTNAQIQQQFAQLQAQYAAMGLDAQKANQMAAMQVQQLQQSGALGAAQAQGQMLGSIMGAVGTGLGAYGALGGGKAAASGGKAS